jgi:Ca-activated chloride channel family protein
LKPLSFRITAAATVLLAFMAIASHMARGQSPPRSSAQAPQAEVPRIKVNVNLVLVDVAVTDDKDQIVGSLGQNDFHVFEDRIEQPLQVFRHEDVPVTVGLLLDSSGSMYGKRQKVNTAAVDFMHTSNPNDEVFLIDFADETYLELDKDFTSDVEELQEALENVQFRSSTVLYDAVYLGLSHIKKGKYDKKVILLVTDGKDNPGPGKHYSFKNAFDYAVESGAQIYCIGLLDEPPKSHFFKKGMPKEAEELKEFAEATGGKVYFPQSVDEIGQVTKEIAHDIRSQYLLGYYPTNTARDGSWRALTVKVDTQGKNQALHVRHKRGYIAPKG